jgi:hypothetical protein
MDVMRGIFAIVKQAGETRLVLQGFDPTNRKVVYVIVNGLDSEVLIADKVQDSPGMARPQEVKLESWYRRMESN